jgi:AbrB family looped-hinge helix DNA binding protein
MGIKISQKGWVVIPSKLRQRYHLEPGAEVQIVDYGGVLAIVPMRANPLDAYPGMPAGEGKSLTLAIEEEHRRERNHDRK